MTALHDISVGPIEACQICGSRNIEPVVDLGHQAPCDSLLTPSQLREAESTYPLRLVRCIDCSLAQIDYAVAPEVLFHREYPYRSGITETLRNNLRSTAFSIIDRFGLSEGSLAIDLGSNDGTLLSGFKDRGMRVLGVEPTDIAEIAREAGIDTRQAFFCEEVGREIAAERGKAAVVTAANMFAHVAQLGSLIRGVEHMLQPGGLFVTESHYLLDLLKTVQYDSIYHEHLKYYSLKTILKLFEYYDFTVVDVERIENYGGSIRVYAMLGRGHEAKPSVAAMLAEEQLARLEDASTYEAFAGRVRKSRVDLQMLILEAMANGHPVPGIGCPGRASTLISYCGLDAQAVPYIAEQSTSLKLGLHLPGKHIPIVDEARLLEEQPPKALMLSWHYWRPIVRNMRRKGLKSQIIVPLPDVTVAEE
ncbi:class I SAM-dependent methyltransferase [Afifella sp. IM 167]|uniref:class I SAM-dependent methyltransferase n=1 Tax=Afifella sp. IM 167 TaxID=2033586 RepID=UPI001CCDE24C|nr:class I SAM-dependent methyltransferase [Afifella sp. IM 167]MBZ8134243.1 methyltransferase [Afifella sp. IM 167]